MGKPREVGRPLRCGPESCERRAVEDERLVRGDRLFQGKPRKLVTESHGAVRLHQHSGGEAFVECRESLSRGLLQQRQLGLRRRNRDGVDQRPRGGREPRSTSENGVANRLGDLLARREHLGDEERIAARLLVQGGRVDSVRLGELRDCLGGEWRDFQPPT
jgi:hypothetical protein